MNKKKPATPVLELPPDVIEADTKYPSFETRVRTGLPEELTYTPLTFYKTSAMGWVLTTLAIGGAGKQATARTYGITVEKQGLVRVGRGPHVLATATVYLSTENIARLQKYVDLWLKGMEGAGNTRDRISSRRAQGQMMRAQGRSSWRWDV